MFSFYRLVEALDQLHEDAGGDAGVAGLPTSSGTTASSAINPPENPARKKKLLSIPIKPEELKKEAEKEPKLADTKLDEFKLTLKDAAKVRGLKKKLVPRELKQVALQLKRSREKESHS
jgi:hypothetical protein